MRKQLRYLMATLATAGMLFATSCKKDSPVEPLKAASITAVSGSGQTARISTALINPMVVKVLDQHGAALQGATVTFTASGGTVTANVTTNTAGTAQTNWTLGNTPGNQSVNACVAGVTTCATFTATATVPVVTSIQKVAGDNQTGAGNTAFAVKPSVKVLDDLGASMSGVAVTFTVTGGSGSITGGSTTTDASGIATVGGWLAGPIGGVHKLRASVAGVTSTVEFTATATGAQTSRSFEVCADTLRLMPIFPPGMKGNCAMVSLIARADSGTGTVASVSMRSMQGAYTSWNDAANSSALYLVWFSPKTGISFGATTKDSVKTQGATQQIGTETISNAWSAVVLQTVLRITGQANNSLKGGATGCNPNGAMTQYTAPYALTQSCNPAFQGSLVVYFHTTGVWTAQDSYYRLQFQFLGGGTGGSVACYEPATPGVAANLFCIRPPKP